MSKIAQDLPTGKEVFIQFYLSPPSIQAFLYRKGRLVRSKGFKSEFNPSDLFDLSQDPPGIIYPAFISRWPWLENAGIDLIATKYPDTACRSGNPHNFANLMLCFVLASALAPPPEAAHSPEAQPHLRIVPKKKPAAAKKIRHNKAPHDVLKYFSHIPTGLTWQPVLKAMYKRSMYLNRKRLTNYTGHYDRDGRFYLKGNVFLATGLGISQATLKRTLSWMKKHFLIKLRHRGYPGEGHSIWELPFNLAHVFAWSRESAKQKTYLP